jgi:hypothetical protein
MTPCQLCKAVQTDRSDGLCGPCRMGSVASEHVKCTSEDPTECDYCQDRGWVLGGHNDQYPCPKCSRAPVAPSPDNAFYSEHVLGHDPAGNPTPHMLRPELRTDALTALRVIRHLVDVSEFASYRQFKDRLIEILDETDAGTDAEDRSSDAWDLSDAEKATKAFLAAVHDGKPCPFCGAKTDSVWPFATHQRGCVIGGLAGYTADVQFNAAERVSETALPPAEEATPPYRTDEEPVIVVRGPFIPNKALIRKSFARADIPESWNEPVDLDKARKAQQRLTNVAFGNVDRETGERIRPHFEIPVSKDDDDIILARALDELAELREQRRPTATAPASCEGILMKVNGQDVRVVDYRDRNSLEIAISLSPADNQSVREMLASLPNYPLDMPEIVAEGDVERVQAWLKTGLRRGQGRESDPIRDRLIRLEGAAGFVVRRIELATSDSLRERIEALKAVLESEEP